MEWVIEVLLTIIFEPIIYIYLDIVQSIIPDKKLKKWQGNFLKVLCAFVTFLSLMLVILGIVWCLDEKPFKTYGTIMLIIGCSVIFLHIILTFFICLKNKLKSQETTTDDSKNDRSEESVEKFENKEPTPIVCYIDDDELN